MVNPDKLFGRLGNRMFQAAYLFAQVKKGLLADVYVQDPSFFEEYEDEIKKWFGEGIGFLDYVAVHVRRGDYVANPFYTDLSQTDYYEKAMNLFPVDKFLFFSDDIAYCKEKWQGERFHYVETGNEVDDFNLMASCKHTIMANSSYSWWAGFLNHNPAKKVIYPKQWFADNVIRVKFPTTWIQI